MGRLLVWLDRLRDEAEARYAQVVAQSRSRAAEAAQKAAATPDMSTDGEEPEPPAPPPTSAAPPPNAASTDLTSSIVPLAPSGRRHEVDGLAFYDDPTMPGFFSVWDEDTMIGEVERLGGPAGPAKVFGGSIRAPLPEYRATREWDQTTFIARDIYEAVRKLGREHRSLEQLV